MFCVSLEIVIVSIVRNCSRNFCQHPNPTYNIKALINADENYAKTISNKLYAIDDNTAIKVIDGNAEITLEGVWKVFN